MIASVASVDMRDFEHGSTGTRADFVSTFGDSLAGTGFVRVCGHQVRADTLANAYRSAQAVFSLPSDCKAQYDSALRNGQRGHIAFGTEQAKGASVVDLKEFWHIGRDDGDTTPNLWPTEVPEFRYSMTTLFAAMDAAASVLLQALAEYFDLETRTLADLVDGADSLLRVLHYPPLVGTSIEGAVRAAAHEDINFITLLPAATDAGLELMDRDGQWSSVDGLEGELVVDTGDMLSLYLNGRIPSTTHRVVNPSDSNSARYSMPFFCQPRPEVLLVPPASLLEAGEVLEGTPVTAGTFHRQRMEEIRLAP